MHAPFSYPAMITRPDMEKSNAVTAAPMGWLDREDNGEVDRTEWSSGVRKMASGTGVRESKSRTSPESFPQAKAWLCGMNLATLTSR